MIDHEPTPEVKKEQWLDELTGFLAESISNGWAGDAKKVKDPVTGEKTLVYEQGEWLLVDKYTGYFAAPGESKVFYKGRHVWSMQYGGEGQKPEYYDEVQQTYAFLKDALMHFDPNLPVRGPRAHYSDGDVWCYRFKMLEGNIENGIWREEIDKRTRDNGDFRVVFSQVGTCGIIVDKDEGFSPVYPWDL